MLHPPGRMSSDQLGIKIDECLCGVSACGRAGRGVRGGERAFARLPKSSGIGYGTVRLRLRKAPSGKGI